MKNRWPALGKQIALLIVPLYILLITFIIKDKLNPYYLTPDPIYNYLICSLHVLNGISPSHTDHPGTAMQIAGALIFKLFHPTASVREITEMVLDNPELYIYRVNAAMVVLFCLSLWFLAFYTLKRSRNFFSALLLQSVPVIYYYGSVYGLTDMKAESLLYIVLNFFIICCVKLYYDQDQKQHLYTAIFFGMICGVGVAAKTTLIPYPLLPLLLIPTWRLKGIYLLSLLVSFFLATSPMGIRGYTRWLEWNMGVATHQGVYGSGAQGYLIPFEQYTKHLSQLINSRLLFWKSIVFFLALIFVKLGVMIKTGKTKRQDNLPLIFLSALILCVGIQLMVVAKHPAGHYLNNTYGLYGLLIFFAVEMFPLRRWKNVVLCLIIFFFVKGAPNQYKGTQQIDNSETRQKITRFHQRLFDNVPRCSIIHADGSDSVIYALHWGDNWHLYNKFGSILKKKYPNMIFYDYWSNSLQDFEKKAPLKPVYNSLKKRKDCIILVGSCHNQFIEHMNLELMDESGDNHCAFYVKSLK